MEVKLSDKAKEEILKLPVKSFRIDAVSNGWAGPVFGLVQGEPRDGDIVVNVGDISFAVEDYYEFIIDHFEIDYSSGVFKRGFAIYPNGERGGC